MGCRWQVWLRLGRHRFNLYGCRVLLASELKGRSYREIDILFQRRIPAREFEKTVIDAAEND
jgi:hypothetical protein